MHLEGYFRNIANYIGSAATGYPNSLGEKYPLWPRTFRLLIGRQIVLCGDKSIIRAEYMIDDNIHDLRRFEARRSSLTHRTIARCRTVPCAVRTRRCPFSALSWRVALQLELIQESDSPRRRLRSSTWAGVLSSTPAHVDDLDRGLGESDS